MAFNPLVMAVGAFNSFQIAFFVFLCRDEFFEFQEPTIGGE